MVIKIQKIGEKRVSCKSNVFDLDGVSHEIFVTGENGMESKSIVTNEQLNQGIEFDVFSSCFELKCETIYQDQRETTFQSKFRI